MDTSLSSAPEIILKKKKNRKQPHNHENLTGQNSILSQHLKLEGNLENPSTDEKTRMHSKELFQKNPICFPQKFFLRKSRDTAPNPAVDRDIGLLLVAGLSCRSSPTAAVPWAASRAAAPRSSCTPGLGLQTLLSMHSFGFVSRAHYH